MRHIITWYGQICLKITRMIAVKQAVVATEQTECRAAEQWIDHVQHYRNRQHKFVSVTVVILEQLVDDGFTTTILVRRA